jgi:hypothetical protein
MLTSRCKGWLPPRAATETGVSAAAITPLRAEDKAERQAVVEKINADVDESSSEYFSGVGDARV